MSGARSPPPGSTGTPREELGPDVASECSSAKPGGSVELTRRPERGLARPRAGGTTPEDHTAYNKCHYLFRCFQKSKRFQTQLRYKIQHKMRFIPISHIKQKSFQKLFCQSQLVDGIFLSSLQRRLPRPRWGSAQGPVSPEPPARRVTSDRTPSLRGSTCFYKPVKASRARGQEGPVPCQKRCHGGTALAECHLRELSCCADGGWGGPRDGPAQVETWSQSPPSCGEHPSAGK